MMVGSVSSSGFELKRRSSSPGAPSLPAAPAGPDARTEARPAQVDARPYPWPFDGPVRPERLALIEVGMQQGRTSTGVSAADALANLSRLRSAVVAVGGIVVRTVRRTACERNGPPSWRIPREAVQVDVDMEPMQGGAVGDERQSVDVVVEAWGSDAVGSGRLDMVLRRWGRTQLLFGGLEAEGPLHSTLAGANDRGYECLLVQDACAGSDEAATAGHCGTIQASGGIFGATACTSSVVAALYPELLA